jgi:hypothetical protein
MFWKSVHIFLLVQPKTRSSFPSSISQNYYKNADKVCKDAEVKGTVTRESKKRNLRGFFSHHPVTRSFLVHYKTIHLCPNPGLGHPEKKVLLKAASFILVYIL